MTEGLVSNVIVLNDQGDLLCAEQDCLEGSMARIVKLAALRWYLNLFNECFRCRISDGRTCAPNTYLGVACGLIPLRVFQCLGP